MNTSQLPDLVRLSLPSAQWPLAAGPRQAQTTTVVTGDLYRLGPLSRCARDLQCHNSEWFTDTPSMMMELTRLRRSIPTWLLY